MKRLLHFSTFIFSFFICFTSFSQTYKVDEKRIYAWDAFASEWTHNLTEQFTYANGGTKETLLQGFSMPGMMLAYQDIKTYNTNNDIILDVGQIWNSVSLQWETTGQTTFTYDGSNNLIEELDQSYNAITQLYENAYRVLYEYSGSNIIKFTYQYWDTSAWVNEDKLDVTYTSGLPTQIINSVWNTTTNMWDLDERDTATYVGGLRTELIVETYNGSGWDLYERYSTTYSGSLEIEYIQQTWNGAVYVNSDRELSVYDGNDNKTEYIWYSWVSNAWEPYYKEEMDYSVAAPLSTNSFEQDSFKIYPNPASDVINIASNTTVDKMELYNVLGEKILQTSNSSKALNIEGLKSGLYILKVFNKNNSASKKIVVK
ncbi:T9SS type A sorting domain-containing protein [Hwangdonia lutea]|uniref:T9SS type A sorting domain-containing protein n=1 Tax=Hwangdonia lutea TaxID=3075823 RepID=A0AA97ENR9_9FLAO|nr:T9SS type A sorting domain-containing protein [Hwangdonia sp. SCSIO 19198]WOD43774.1 T9SS type A sorting domain-containing protein [Hwangdonia sp. SCSIO 19198]